MATTTTTSSHSAVSSRSRSAEILDELLAPMGVQVDGDAPWDPQIRDPAFFTHAVPRGTKGILDAYVDGWWECDRLDELTHRFLRSPRKLPAAQALSLAWHTLVARITNRQSRRRGDSVRRHYDRGNDLFEAMLDRGMNYSCAYWRDAETLEEAQEAKLDLVARKVGLEPGMRVLDVGCGWGGFAHFAAERHGASVTGITLSEPQVELARARCEGLPVTIRKMDYRDLPEERYDAVISIGMIEHVGYKNYRTFLEVARRCLKPEGLFLLHTIGNKHSRRSIDPWIHENVFPDGMLPSLAQLAKAAEGLFVVEDVHNFGADYDHTLMAWYERFDAAWSDLRPNYGDRFYRLWRCYLMTCAGSFRARENQLYQLVLSPEGVPGGWQPVR